MREDVKKEVQICEDLLKASNQCLMSYRQQREVKVSECKLKSLEGAQTRLDQYTKVLGVMARKPWRRQFTREALLWAIIEAAEAKTKVIGEIADEKFHLNMLKNPKPPPMPEKVALAVDSGKVDAVKEAIAGGKAIEALTKPLPEVEADGWKTEYPKTETSGTVKDSSHLYKVYCGDQVGTGFIGETDKVGITGFIGETDKVEIKMDVEDAYTKCITNPDSVWEKKDGEQLVRVSLSKEGSTELGCWDRDGVFRKNPDSCGAAFDPYALVDKWTHREVTFFLRRLDKKSFKRWLDAIEKEAGKRARVHLKNLAKKAKPKQDAVILNAAWEDKPVSTTKDLSKKGFTGKGRKKAK